MKFRYLEFFSVSIFTYISLKIGYFELGYDYDVTVTLDLVLMLVCMEWVDPSYRDAIYGIN